MKAINRKFYIQGTFCCAVAVVALIGCSGGNGRQSVSGSVTLGGQPVASGAISFRPAEGTDGPSAGGAIKDGHFTLEKANGLLPGKYTVGIQAFRKTGRIVNDPQFGKTDEMVPVRFREEGTLEATVTSGSDNQFEYALTLVP